MVITKKGQEEMIGFVLIIILVAVVGVVFLGISLRQPTELTQSKDIENFLQSSLVLTTSCKGGPDYIYDFASLIEACYENKRCHDGNHSCDVLNKTSYEIMEDSWRSGKYKGYEFKIYKRAEEESLSSGYEELINIESGNMTSTRKGSEVPLSVPDGKLYLRLEIYS